MKLSFLKALILVFLIATPKNTKCFDRDRVGLVGIGAVVIACICGIYYYFSPSDEQVIQNCQELHEQSLKDFNIYLENLENIVGQKNSWDVHEHDLEILACQIGSIDNLNYRFSLQINGLRDSQRKVKKIINKIAKKSTYEERLQFEDAQKLERKIDTLLKRFVRIHDILKNNNEYFRFRDFVQAMQAKYGQHTNLSLDEIISSIKRTGKEFPLFHYVDEMQPAIQQSEFYVNHLSKYPVAMQNARIIYKKLENIKDAITTDYRYQDELLDHKKKLLEEKEKRLEEKRREMKHREEEIERQAADQFFTAIGQGLQQHKLDQERKKISLEKLNLQQERERILQQQLDYAYLATIKQQQAADFAALAGYYAAQKIAKIQKRPPINPALLNYVNGEQLVLNIEQDEYINAYNDLQSAESIPRKYTTEEIKERVTKKVEEAFGIREYT